MMMDDKESTDQPKVSRRDVVTAGLGVAAGAAFRHFLGNFGETKPTAPALVPVPIVIQSEKPLLPPAEEKEILADNDLLNQILDLEPYSPERIGKEAEYFVRAKSLEQIDKGFWALNSRDLRGALLHKRFQLRERGILPMIITAEETRWAKSQGIHPETLAICKDTFIKAKKVLEKLYPNDPDIELRIINPGGLAKLMTEETGRALGGSDISYAFNYVGEQAAEKHINPIAFPKDKTALATLCEKLSANTGLKFKPEKVAGSYRGSALSGGAIGAQFMPSTALEIYEDMEKVGEKFNPFDPKSAVIGAWVYLAKRGYKRGYPEDIKQAVKGWNADEGEIDKVIKAANSFYDGFVQKPTPALAQR